MFDSLHKVIAFVKDEGINLTTMATTKNVNVKKIQVGLQNTITWTKKFKEGKQ